MNSTSRAILQTVLATDNSLSDIERGAIQRLITGEMPAPMAPSRLGGEPLLVTQKAAAEFLSVSRVTIWRMTKDNLLHPVEILPGTWRYSYQEIAAFTRSASSDPSAVGTGPRRSRPCGLSRGSASLSRNWE
jgi:predicted DNA-binding transcriptional regulator AlpA